MPLPDWFALLFVVYCAGGITWIIVGDILDKKRLAKRKYEEATIGTAEVILSE